MWRRLDAEPGDLSDLLDVANRVANVDGAVNARERGVISQLQDLCAASLTVVGKPGYRDNHRRR